MAEQKRMRGRKPPWTRAQKPHGRVIRTMPPRCDVTIGEVLDDARRIRVNPGRRCRRPGTEACGRCWQHCVDRWAFRECTGVK